MRATQTQNELRPLGCRLLREWMDSVGDDGRPAMTVANLATLLSKTPQTIRGYRAGRKPDRDAAGTIDILSHGRVAVSSWSQKDTQDREPSKLRQARRYRPGQGQACPAL